MRHLDCPKSDAKRENIIQLYSTGKHTSLQRLQTFSGQCSGIPCGRHLPRAQGNVLHSLRICQLVFLWKITSLIDAALSDEEAHQ